MQDGNLDSLLQQAAALIRRWQPCVALSGAGISVESGIPSFRGAQGLWTKYDPMKYATIEAFMADPKEVWNMLADLDQVVMNAEPNPAHRALARMEAMGLLDVVVTQNIDGLHQAGGSQKVIEFHGSGRRLSCLSCHKVISRKELELGSLPPRCACGGVLKPEVVFIGEVIPFTVLEAAYRLAGQCGSMLVVGTSASIAPASQLPQQAKAHGAKVIELNPEPTWLSEGVSDLVIAAGAGEALPRLAEILEQTRP
jgi:NAD-dependent deacetylase